MSPFARSRSDSVAALGEVKLITAIRRWLGKSAPDSPAGMGDDCAVLPAAKYPQLITVDPVIHGRHFDDQVPPRAVGAKLLKRNLSDIAAMGGTPTSAVVALTLDPRTSQQWVEEFYRGLATCARRYGVSIVGGDITQAKGTVAASLTLLGTTGGRRPLTRDGAALGDWIYVTGVLGGSLVSGHHFKFTPRLAEGAWLACQKPVTAAMDLSDGLAKDIHALTPAGAFPMIDASRLPLRAGQDTKAALSDGEDYELLFTVRGKADQAAFVRKWRQQFPRTRLTCIGRYTTLQPPSERSLNLECYYGFEHLR
jgi:thiamine-monophosphate kinase